MRVAWALLLLSGMAWGQTADAQKPDTGVSPPPAAAAAPSAAPAAASDPNAVTIPAGTMIPLSLKQAISTKNAREGDAVYAETAFPFLMNERVIVPAGTYIQGKISHVERAGHGHGRAEILIHFTSMIYPSGYTVMLPGSVENTPGAENNSVKDQEGRFSRTAKPGKKWKMPPRTGRTEPWAALRREGWPEG
jgi:type IV secretory pathway VirB10-like protein